MKCREVGNFKVVCPGDGARCQAPLPTVAGMACKVAVLTLSPMTVRWEVRSTASRSSPNIAITPSPTNLSTPPRAAGWFRRYLTTIVPVMYR